jgi:NAD(P)-dependent dehydrogenase (short-subunit alcohol dehydrogenase family)
MDLTGKTCIVTGANCGLGFEVAKGLAERGAVTTLLCRNRDKGETALREIQRELPDAVLDLAICDLSSLREIRDFVDGFERKHSKLDILYNNAAVMKPKRTVTDDGFETMFEVNYLAAYALMMGLLEPLRQGDAPLVINAASPGYDLRLDLDDLQFARAYRMYECFFKTKLCLLMSALEFSRRDESDGVAVTMIVPGRPFRSNLVRDVRFGWIKNLVSGSVHAAAEDVLRHIDATPVATMDGRVFEGRKERPISEYWQDSDIAARLWSMTGSMVAAA